MNDKEAPSEIYQEVWAAVGPYGVELIDVTHPVAWAHVQTRRVKGLLVTTSEAARRAEGGINVQLFKGEGIQIK